MDTIEIQLRQSEETKAILKTLEAKKEDYKSDIKAFLAIILYPNVAKKLTWITKDSVRKTNQFRSILKSFSKRKMSNAFKGNKTLKLLTRNFIELKRKDILSEYSED